MVPDVNIATVQVGEDPWLGGVQLDALDPIGPLYELAFDVKAERHAARAFCEDSGLRRVTKKL